MAADRHGNQDDTIYSNNRFVGETHLIIIFGNSTDNLKSKRRRFFPG
jgi:hypothetical protein